MRMRLTGSFPQSKKSLKMILRLKQLQQLTIRLELVWQIFSNEEVTKNLTHIIRSLQDHCNCSPFVLFFYKL